MIAKMRSFPGLSLFLLLLLTIPYLLQAKETPPSDESEKHVPVTGFKGWFFDKEKDFFPVPVFQTRPDEGQTYGLMPVLLLSDKDSHAISTIIAAIGQWNEVVKFSGAAVFYHFFQPVKNPDQQLQIYAQWGQKFYREASARYFDPDFLGHFYLDTNFIWLQTPFRRFYGYGAATPKAAESNYLSSSLTGSVAFGYYFLKDLRLTLTESVLSTDISSRAITDVADTLTAFAGVSGVEDDFNWVHRLAMTLDTRPSGLNSKRGTLIEGAFFISDTVLGSDHRFRGYSFEAVHLLSYLKERMTTAARVYLQDMYGSSIPFYLQSTLGGDKELRSFIPNRFIDTGKILFSIEQRMRVVRKNIFGIPCEMWADPFLEVGRVFHHINHLGADDYQTVAGLGIRFIVPPNVTARIDLGIGSEGYNVYTQLGYPF